MSIKNTLKKVPGIGTLHSILKGKENVHKELSQLSNDQLLSLMRHESHRIEKTIYNNILESKYSTYLEKWKKLSVIYEILDNRGYDLNEPTIVWSRKIYDAFDNLEQEFIQKNSLPASKFAQDLAVPFIEFLRARRSVRVWAQEQPDVQAFEQIAHNMIDAARWAPTSGNRQPWRFLTLIKPEEKELLKGIKENHCTSAPLLIFVGMDTRLYGAFAKSERSIYIDAGAAIMQMVLVAHKCGLGVCWNHFADDLINSRESNESIYFNFTKKLNIPDYITPIAIIATGVSKFIPPEPARMDIESLMIKDSRTQSSHGE